MFTIGQKAEDGRKGRAFTAMERYVRTRPQPAAGTHHNQLTTGMHVYQTISHAVSSCPHWSGTTGGLMARTGLPQILLQFFCVFAHSEYRVQLSGVSCRLRHAQTQSPTHCHQKKGIIFGRELHCRIEAPKPVPARHDVVIMFSRRLGGGDHASCGHE